jgi:hypothetical protein
MFLKVIGIFDIVIGILVWTKAGSIPSLVYATLWGTGTALARVLGNVRLESLASDLFQWLPETIYRLPHGLLPLAALAFVIQTQRMKQISNETRYTNFLSIPLLFFRGPVKK